MEYDLDELERLEKAATPGEWAFTGFDHNAQPQIHGTHNLVAVVAHEGVRTNTETQADAALITATRNALPAMIRDLRAMRAMLKRLEWGGDEIEDTCPACRRWRGKGHAPGCELAALLAGENNEGGAK